MVMEKYFKGIEAAQAPPVLPRDTWWVVRVDGRAFHTFTEAMRFERPYDPWFMGSMNKTAMRLCEEIQNARLAYVQSDEISVLVKAEGDKAQTWFGGDRDKVVSISAAVASSSMARDWETHTAQFDSRVFTLDNLLDVQRYFLWRQNDAFRNAVSMTAQTHFSHNQLKGIGTGAQIRMLQAKTGLSLEALLPEGFRRGRLVSPHTVKESVTFQHKKTGEMMTQDEVERRSWRAVAAPWFEDEPVL